MISGPNFQRCRPLPHIINEYRSFFVFLYDNNILYALITTFRFIPASSGIFLYWKTGYWKRTQMQVNPECSARKYKSARASSFLYTKNRKKEQVVIFEENLVPLLPRVGFREHGHWFVGPTQRALWNGLKTFFLKNMKTTGLIFCPINLC